MEQAKEQTPTVGAEAAAELKMNEGLAALTGNRSSKRPSAWSVIRKQRLAFVGLIIILFFALMAIFGPTIRELRLCSR